MSPEDQRIAIAKACGWTIHQITVTGLKDVAILPPGVSIKDEGAVWNYAGTDLPDYLNDLNAMHEAEIYAGEHLMDADQWEQYGKSLEAAHPHACLKTPNEERVDYYDFATLMTEVTASQRAKTFLRTLNLWKD